MIFITYYFSHFLQDKIKLYWERQATQEEDVIVKRNSMKKKGGLPPTAFATFNLCIFGASKYNKTIVKDYIVKILSRYDIMTVQVRVVIVKK